MSATNRGLKRIKNDAYQTPSWLTEAIVPELINRLGTGDMRVYEPACGNGQMVSVLNNYFTDVVGTDLVGEKSVDFLSTPASPEYDLIITNPPYSCAQEFVTKAFQWRRSKDSVVAMLLRINFLGSMKRAKWFRNNIPAIYVTPKRPKFSLNKHGKLASDATEYAWFVWQEPFKKTSEIGILNTENLFLLP